MKVFSIEELKRAVHWILVIVTVLMVVSGYGITEFRIVETISFGIISKANAFKMHMVLAIPFLLLLLLHVYLTLKNKVRLE